jgi:hypothetical protein
VNVVHHDEEFRRVDHYVERGNDVGVPNARGQARLVQEHLDELRIARVLRVQLLDGNGPRKALGAH